MAPESERAKRYEEIGNYLDFSSTRTTDHVGSNLWKHCSFLLDRIRELDTPKPNEPTLTCSEVVERLEKECLVYGDDPHSGIVGLDRKLAESILHSWRERRVQELEELLREVFHDLRQRAMPNHDDPWFEKTERVLAKHSLTPEPQSTQLDTGKEK